MRVAVLHIPSFPNVKGDSDFLSFKHIADGMLDVREDLFFYFFVQDEGLPILTKEPHFAWLSQGQVGVFYDNQGSPPRSFLEMFNPRVCKYPVDLIWTSRVGATLAFNRAMMEHRVDRDLVPIVTTDAKVASFDEKHQTVTDNLLMANAFGYAASYPTFSSQHELDLATDVCKHYLASSMVSRVLSKAQIIPFGFQARRIDSLVTDVEKRDVFTIFFGGRLNVTKRAENMVEMYSKFYAAGRNIDIMICSPKADRAGLGRAGGKFGISHVEYHPACPSDTFIRLAASAYIYVNTSRLEGWPVGTVEQMYVGLVSILPKAQWVRGILLEQFDSYPFLYHNFDEAVAMLHYVYENYDEAKQKVAHIPKFLADNFGHHVISPRFLGLFDELVESHDPGLALLSPRNTQLITAALDRMGDEFSLDGLYDEMVGMSDAMQGEARRGQISKWIIYKHLCRHKKFEDTCRSAMPIFRRIE